MDHRTFLARRRADRIGKALLAVVAVFALVLVVLRT